MLWRISLLLFVGISPAHAVFELLGTGARSSALGGAFSAADNAAETLWFNPAGNARIDGLRAETTHALLYPAIEDSPSLHGLAMAAPWGGGSAQIGWSFLSANGWREDVLALGFGYPINARIALGADLRNGGWSAGKWGRRSWSMDLGLTYEVGYVLGAQYIRLAVVGQNLNAANIARGQQASGALQRRGVVAAALVNEHFRLLLDVERAQGRTEVRVGYEGRTVSLNGAWFRLGGAVVNGDFPEAVLNAGIGHEWKAWNFDYAYSQSPILSGWGGGHRLSVGYQLR